MELKYYLLMRKSLRGEVWGVVSVLTFLLQFRPSFCCGHAGSVLSYE